MQDGGGEKEDLRWKQTLTFNALYLWMEGWEEERGEEGGG